MKILIVLIRFAGGLGRSNIEIKRRLTKRGHLVDILSREDDLKIYNFVPSIFPLRKKIKQLMKKNNYDIIYTQDYSTNLPLLLPFPLFWKKHFSCFCGTKTWGIHKLVQYIVGMIMNKKLVVVCNELKKRFPKSTLIHRGINFKEFRKLGKKREFLGWADRDLEDISREDLQKISKSSNLKISVAKGIPSNKMNEFYNKCKVFVSLPYRGGYNNVWAEAMAAGVPIVIGNKKGPGNIFPFNKVLDSENKIEKIIKIIKKPKRINYRKWLIKKGFSWENKAKELINFFEKRYQK